MKSRHIILVILIMGLWSLSALAVTPEGGIIDNEIHSAKLSAVKAFGDPTDFMAAAEAGADYIRYMQSDITEDNAGNGPVDSDNQDGGWDWVTSTFEHSTTGSPSNLYGVTAAALYESYKRNPSPAIWTAMTDAANFMADPLNGPNTVYDIDSSPDVTFLMKYADLPGVLNPTYYRTAAKAIWDDRKTLGGGSSASDYITYLYSAWVQDSGIEAWDTASFCEGCLMLNTHFGAPYLDDANEIADYFYNDSFDTDGDNLGWFLVEDTAHGYREYTLGVTGLINMFHMTGLHLDKLPVLNQLLLESQNTDGSFNYYYGQTGDAEFQTTAYAIRALSCCLPDNQTNKDAMYSASVWLGSLQDSSGAFLESGGTHYPEVGAECSVALFLAADAFSADIGGSVAEALINCSEGNEITFSLDIHDATPLVIGFEVVLDITALTFPTTINFTEDSSLNAGFFQVTGNVTINGTGGYLVTGPGPYSVNGSFFYPDGISADADLFGITFAGLSEGSVDVSVSSYKLRGPENIFIFGDVSGAGFVVDCTAPDAVTNITAAPHHNKVEVGWTHDGTDVDKYRVYRGMWNDGDILVSAYPEYDDLTTFAIPAHPAAGLPDPGQGWVRADGDNLGFAVDSFFDVFLEMNNDMQRGAFSYEVYAVDAAGNISDPASENDAATNYWLGDLTPVGGGNSDGHVESMNDMTQLGSAFGTSEAGGGAYNAFCDVGPTDDWSRVGIPTTDNYVNFEDLMVFSMNFGVVTDLNKTTDNISSTVQLAWVDAGEGQYALRLVDGLGVKGVHVTCNHSVSGVIAGDLLDAQDEMTFLKNIGSAMDISVAVMGRDNGFSGSGDLFIVSSRDLIDVADLNIEVRGHDNSVIQVSLDGTSGTVTPRTFALNAAFPNPFNPMTKISFSLPEAQDVRLNVYGIDGKLVASLVNETRGAGLHEVIWNGQNDAGQVQASGLYFYRIEAGPYSEVQKMTLMK